MIKELNIKEIDYAINHIFDGYIDPIEDPIEEYKRKIEEDVNAIISIIDSIKDNITPSFIFDKELNEYRYPVLSVLLNIIRENGNI